MTIQRGKDLLLKLDSTGSSAFVTIGGLRARSISLNAGTVDITHSESPGEWRELLAGAGVRSASLSGAGLFKDEAADAALREIFFSGVIRAWQIIVPDFGTMQGPFQISSLEYSGQHDREMTFEISMESAGQLTFTGAS
ncbi:MAG: phage major tail protein, TP901-1 family [Parvibaculaceae bacterium]|nr:phage major tail protein, TP901-1 family [Parvibaculaceae bacterium]